VETELERCESRLRTQETELAKVTTQIKELRGLPSPPPRPALAASNSTELDRPRQIS
jgi:hypothetical protein